MRDVQLEWTNLGKAENFRVAVATPDSGNTYEIRNNFDPNVGVNEKTCELTAYVGKERYTLRDVDWTTAVNRAEELEVFSQAV